MSKIFKSIYILFAVLVFSSCEEDVKVPEKTDEQLVMSEYIAKNSEYSEFDALLKSSKLDNLLSIRGPYTLFLPNNDAIKAYCAEKQITSITDLDSVAQKELVYNHVVPKEFRVSQFQMGTLGEIVDKGALNALGDNIVTEYEGAEIIVNKFSRVKKRDVTVSNGTMHVIDKVLEPVKLSVYDILASNPSYSIFAEGLNRTGLKDTLDRISFKYGTKEARVRFTILAVADSTFKRIGIKSIDDLIKRYTNSLDSITFVGNGFYDYMEFHCLDKNAYYTSDFTNYAKLYAVLSNRNNVQVTMQNDIYKVNINPVDNSYTKIILKHSNIPAKNGVIHTVDNLLEVVTNEPEFVTFEVTDYFDLMQGEYYLKHFEKFYDKNQFKQIKWEGDYLQYYIKAAKDAQTELNDDCLNMMGFWEIEVTTPKIMKGRYTIASRVWNGCSYAVYIDGIQVAIFKGSDAPTITSIKNSSKDPAALYDWGSVNWTTTSEHKIKLAAQTSCTLFWDRVEFAPVK